GQYEEKINPGSPEPESQRQMEDQDAGGRKSAQRVEFHDSFGRGLPFSGYNNGRCLRLLLDRTHVAHSNSNILRLEFIPPSTLGRIGELVLEPEDRFLDP